MESDISVFMVNRDGMKASGWIEGEDFLNLRFVKDGRNLNAKVTVGVDFYNYVDFDCPRHRWNVRILDEAGRIMADYECTSLVDVLASLSKVNTDSNRIDQLTPRLNLSPIHRQE